MPLIRIEIDKEGNVTIDHQGFAGEACEKEDKRLYEILKGQGAQIEIKQITKKPEAYISTKTKSEVKEI